jgi:hypothetical protein
VRLEQVPEDEERDREADDEAAHIAPGLQELQDGREDAERAQGDADRPGPGLERPESVRNGQADHRVDQRDEARSDAKALHVRDCGTVEGRNTKDGKRSE